MTITIPRHALPPATTTFDSAGRRILVGLEQPPMPKFTALPAVPPDGSMPLRRKELGGFGYIVEGGAACALGVVMGVAIGLGNMTAAERAVELALAGVAVLFGGARAIYGVGCSLFATRASDDEIRKALPSNWEEIEPALAAGFKAIEAGDLKTARGKLAHAYFSAIANSGSLEPRVAQLLGWLAEADGDFDEARRFYERLEWGAQDPTLQQEARFALARIDVYRGKDRDAVHRLSKAVAADPEAQHEFTKQARALIAVFDRKETPPVL